MGRQSNKLVETLSLKEVAQGVGLGGTDVYIANHQGVSFMVKEVAEMVCYTWESFILGAVDVDYIQLSSGYFY